MKTITLIDLIERLRDYLDGKCDFEFVRRLVYSPYESEEDLVVDDDADDLLSVLSPYVQTEEAFGDNHRDFRLRRIVSLFDQPPHSSPAAIAVFALNFDEIAELRSKVDNGVIPENVYRDQLSKLSPAEYDADTIVKWARRHQGDLEPQPEKIK